MVGQGTFDGRYSRLDGVYNGRDGWTKGRWEKRWGLVIWEERSDKQRLGLIVYQLDSEVAY